MTVAPAPTTSLQPRRPQGADTGWRGRGARRWAWLVVAVLGAFGLLPVYWLLVTSLKPANETFAYPPTILPREITFDAYAQLLDSPELLRALVNSVIVSVATAVLSVIVASYMAYAFAKYRFRGRKSLMSFVLSSQLFPQSLLLITLYAVFAATGLLNTYLVVILSFTTFTLPLCVWMLKGFFDTIDDSLIEAAKVDRASRMRIIHSIVLPISAPAFVVAMIWQFTSAWNDFLFALFLTNRNNGPVTYALNELAGGQNPDYPSIMAGVLLASLPTLLVYVLLGRYFIGGLMSGSVK